MPQSAKAATAGQAIASTRSIVAWNQSNASGGVPDPINDVEEALDDGATGRTTQDELIAIESEALPRYGLAEPARLVVAVGHLRRGAPLVDVVVPGLRGGKGHGMEAFPPDVGRGGQTWVNTLHPGYGPKL
jgi:hypothetical protein